MRNGSKRGWAALHLGSAARAALCFGSVCSWTIVIGCNATGSAAAGSTPALTPAASDNAASSPKSPSPDPAARFSAPAQPGKNVPWIKVNTVGYPRAWQKIAILNREPRQLQVQTTDGKLVANIAAAQIRKLGIDRASRDPVWHADFSALNEPGEYVLVDADAKSDPFRIGDGLYRQSLIAAQKMLYFQRTRTKLEKPFAIWEGDEFLRPGVSHAHPEVGWLFEDFPEKKRRVSLEAGWHDAGNYDMYVPSTAPTAHGMLRAYEQHPELFRDGDNNIPESKNGIPDLLDEAAWGIRWVLSMQAEDGGFRVREANEKIGEPGNVPADRDRTARWVDRVGSASTGKACALLAATARVYRRFDPKLAERAEAAAKRAFAWLESHPKRVTVPAVGQAALDQPWQLWDDGPKVKSDVGARILAAAEMWRTFQLPAALAQLEKLKDHPETGPYQYPYGAWTNLTRWAMMSLATDEHVPAGLREEARKRMFTAALSMKGQAEEDGYLCATTPNDYYWGSNSNLLEKAEILLFASEQDPKGFGWARQAARNQWHWILGRNPNGYSMVTRVGKGPEALYHAEWGPHFPKVPPGYLIDGPNHQDMAMLSPEAPAKALLWHAPQDLKSGVRSGGLWHWAQSDLWEAGFVPEGSYAKGWWYVTEPDIYMNMNLILVAAAMQ